jgi:hypothetical protein
MSDPTPNIDVFLLQGGIEHRVSVPQGTDLGHIRTLNNDLDSIGAPSSYSLAINGAGQDDNKVLEQGDKISFRPISSSKG